MKTSLLCLLLFLFMSCNTLSSDTKNNDTSIIETEQNSDTDSLVRIEEQKAISNIKFGISEKEFNRQHDSLMKQIKTDLATFTASDVSCLYKIGGYCISRIDGSFYHDSLYYIETMGSLISYEDYDQNMPGQYKALSNLLSQKFGAPVKDLSLPKWSMVEKGYTQLCQRWVIGKRTVESRIMCGGTEYALNLCSYLPAVDSAIKAEVDTKEKVEAEKGSQNL